jgi:hypothetical protein
VVQVLTVFVQASPLDVHLLLVVVLHTGSARALVIATTPASAAIFVNLSISAIIHLLYRRIDAPDKLKHP